MTIIIGFSAEHFALTKAQSRKRARRAADVVTIGLWLEQQNINLLFIVTIYCKDYKDYKDYKIQCHITL